MLKGANKTLIGGFVLGGVALILTAVLIFGSGTLFSDKYRMVMFFQESVSGLNPGAPVVFRGVTIGSVVSIQLWTYPREMKIQIPVYVDIDLSRFKEIGGQSSEQNLDRQIQKGLRAQLKMQSLVTGQMMIYVDYFPDKPVHLVKADPEVLEVPTIPSGVEELTKALDQIPIQQIALKATKAVDGIERLINSPEIKQAVINLNGVLADFRKVAHNLDGKLDQSQGTLQGVQQLVKKVDDRIGPLATEIQEALGDARQLMQNADGQIIPLAGSLKTTLDEVGGVLEEARQTLSKASKIISDESNLSAEVINSLDEMNRTMRSIQLLAEYLKQHPEALLRGKSPSGGK